MISLLHLEIAARRDEYRQSFRSADYFPHIHIENFFDEATCLQLTAEFPAYDVKDAINELGQVGLKAWRQRVRELGETYARIDDTIRSSQFLQLMSDVTGIPDLRYDPEYIGGGTHENLHGSELDIHVDFNYHPTTGWHRRLNLIIFLNEEWQEDWGGNFEVHKNPWNPDEDEYKSFPPFFNHAVIFETSERSWHGFDKIRLPADKQHLSRKSLAVYFYTEGRPAKEVAPSHATIYVLRPLPPQIAPGRVLTGDDVDNLKNLLIKRDQQIHFLYEREKELSQLSDQAAGLLRRNRKLEGMVENLINPLIRGAAEFIENPEGLWKDRWVGPALEARIRALQPITLLTIRGFVADFLAPQRTIQVEIGPRTFEQTIGHGPMEICLEVDIPQNTEEVFRIRCSDTVLPQAIGLSGDDRELAYQLTSITAS